MYNKLFTKILDSSIWLEPTTTRIVWLTIIAAMTEDGIAQFASVDNLAYRARVTIDECREAVKTLEGPDPNSGDEDNEGRRIERIPGGWLVLNAHKYRAMVSRVVVQEQTRERVRRHRERNGIKRGAVTRKPKVDSRIYTPDCRALLHHLNEKSGRRFREVDDSLALIQERLNEKEVDADGCKKMIDRQVARWKGDPRMEEYLRPSTLFGKKKFNEYYAAKDQPLPTHHANNPTTHAQSVDRNRGTFSEGTDGSKYANVGRISSNFQNPG